MMGFRGIRIGLWELPVAQVTVTGDVPDPDANGCGHDTLSTGCFIVLCFMCFLLS